MKFLRLIFAIILMLGFINAKVTNYGRSVYVDPTFANGKVLSGGKITVALIGKNGTIVAKKSAFLNKNSRFKVIFPKNIKPFKKIKFYFKPKGKKITYVWLSRHTKTGAKTIIKSSKKPYYKFNFEIIKLKSKTIGSKGGFAISGRVTT